MLSKPQFVGERVRLGDCFPYIKNGYNSRQGKDKGGVPITRIETLSDNKFNRNKVGYANIFSTEGLEKHVLEDGDILMSHINSLPYLGRSVMYRARPGEVFIHGMNLLRLKADRSIVEPEYAELYFRSPRFKQQVSKIAKKAVNQASFSVSNLKELEFPLMSLCDQRDVIKKLSFITAQIEYNQKAIGELSLLVKSRFVEMFGDPATADAKHELLAIGNFADVQTGATPLRRESKYYGGSIPWVKTGEVSRNFANGVEENITETAIKETNCKVFPAGAILVAMYGQGDTRGKAAILPFEAATNQACAAIMPSPAHNEVFLNAQLQLLYEDMRAKSLGGNQKNLSLGIIKSMKVILPPMEAQQEFATFVSQVDKSRFISMSRYRDILIKNGYRHPHLQGFNR
ncbi:MAG: restriction endonuclease subunit S [Atopobium sp.]|nr:restriction endonuclease subunit S [Atopobium sp.]